jgi:hypothetical protein
MFVTVGEAMRVGYMRLCWFVGPAPTRETREEREVIAPGRRTPHAATRADRDARVSSAMSAFNYVVSAQKPTNVTHAVVGNFTAADVYNFKRENRLIFVLQVEDLHLEHLSAVRSCR